MKRCIGAVLFVVVLLFSFQVDAKISRELEEAVENTYTPSLPQDGLISAQAGLDSEKLRTIVVVEKGGIIPAERAFYFITPQNYDYRGAVIDGESVKTRNGRPYMYLPQGAVMAVADVVRSGRTIYLKLISLRAMQSSTRPKKKATRVTVMLGFKFDKSVYDNNEVIKVLSKIKEWVTPFSNVNDAVAYSEKKDPIVQE
jgi:hypothetical protein